MECGWISIHRKIKEHWVWEDKPFSKGQAWIDILLMANHADKKILLGNELIEVKRGSFITSEKKLMENWGWGKEKVRRFLQVLQEDGMIDKKSDRKKTTINVVNYDFFQDRNSQSRPLSDHEQTNSRPSADTNNNDNNINKGVPKGTHQKKNASVHDGTNGCHMPEGMTEEEYQRRIKELMR